MVFGINKGGLVGRYNQGYDNWDEELHFVILYVEILIGSLGHIKELAKGLFYDNFVIRNSLHP